MTGGTAILCGPAGGSLALPPYCPSPTCRKARDEAAIARAVAAGIIDP